LQSTSKVLVLRGSLDQATKKPLCIFNQILQTRLRREEMRNTHNG